MPITLHTNKLHINDLKMSGAMDILTYETQESLDAIQAQINPQNGTLTQEINEFQTNWEEKETAIDNKINAILNETIPNIIQIIEGTDGNGGIKGDLNTFISNKEKIIGGENKDGAGGIKGDLTNFINNKKNEINKTPDGIKADLTTFIEGKKVEIGGPNKDGTGGIKGDLTNFIADTDGQIEQIKQDIYDQGETVLTNVDQQLANSVDAAIRAADTAVVNDDVRNIIAKPFDNSRKYFKGEYFLVTESSEAEAPAKLYKFINDHEAGSFNDDEIIEVHNANELSDIKIGLNKFLNYERIDSWIEQYYINTGLNIGANLTNNLNSPVASATWRYLIIDCQENDIFTITGTGAGKPRLWCFIDNGNLILDVATPNIVGNNLIISAPQNARRLIVHDNTGVGQVYQATSLNNDFNILQKYIDYTPFYNWRNNYYVAYDASAAQDLIKIKTLGNELELVQNELWRYMIIPCKEHDIFTINCEGAGYPRLWCFTDDSFNIIKISVRNLKGNNLIIEAPEGSTQLIINDKGIGNNHKITYTGYVHKGYPLTEKIFDYINNPITVENCGDYNPGSYFKTADGKAGTNNRFICIPDFIYINKCNKILIKNRPQNYASMYILFYDNYDYILNTYVQTNSIDENVSFLIPEGATRFIIQFSYSSNVQDETTDPPIIFDPTLYGNLTIYKMYSKLNSYSFNNGDLFNEVDIDEKIQQYTNLIGKETEFDNFIFYTDPHLLANVGTTERVPYCMTILQKYYNSLPLDFVLCGGDWINSRDTKSQAKKKFGYIDGFCNKMFNKHYMILGNHDYNYQGYNEDITPMVVNTGELPIQTINNLFFRPYKKAYYSFETRDSIFYILDSGVVDPAAGTTYEDALTDYRKEQLSWLATELQHTTKSHIVIGIHMFTINQSFEDENTNEMVTIPIIPRFTIEIGNLIKAYHQLLSYTIPDSNITFNFTSSTGGAIEFLIAGHTHKDYMYNANELVATDLTESYSFPIPVLVTTNFYDARKKRASEPTFDIIHADYTNRKLYAVRVGSVEETDIRTLDLI